LVIRPGNVQILHVSPLAECMALPMSDTSQEGLQNRHWAIGKIQALIGPHASNIPCFPKSASGIAQRGYAQQS
jgi:hypothetical protein